MYISKVVTIQKHDMHYKSGIGKSALGVLGSK